MITVAGGDSMTWGSELADSLHGGPGGYSRNTFAALLAGDDYVCSAYPGISNYEIAERVKKEIDAGTPNAVIICWTWPSRDAVYISSEVILDFQQYCDHQQIPYLFTCVDNCLIELLSPETNWDHWYLFPAGTKSHETQQPRGFYQWAVENKYNTGIDGHPLEEAHRDAAQLIKEKFNELVTQFNQQN